MNLLRAFVADNRGASAVEFVLVVPVLALFVFGAIDVGFFALRLNFAEKAVQAGVRYAAVTDPVASGLATQDYTGATVGTTTLTAGDVIPAGALGLVQCDNSTCTCPTAPCITSLTRNATAFSNIVARMQVYDPTVQAANVLVEYRGSGLGYAGDPGGMQIVPLVTVRLRNMSYSPLTGFIFKAAISLPGFSSTMTAEDSSGSKSN